MTRVLLTAFEPYDTWTSNASWLALAELLRELTTPLEVTTRLYPVDLDAVKDRLSTDMKAKPDYVFHLGQSPGSATICLEEVAINIATGGKELSQQEFVHPVSAHGPVAYSSQLPLANYAQGLRDAGIPARVSRHAGTFLCNAIMYWSHQLIADLDLPTRATFVHIPLETSQVISLDQPMAFMPKEMVAQALQWLLRSIEQDLDQERSSSA